MTKPTAVDDTTKRAAIRLLSRGLATQAEVARLAGVSRQRVAHWAQELPLKDVRNEVLQAMWRKMTRKR